MLSNEYGTRPLVVGAAHVAVSDKGAAIEAASDRTLTFGRFSLEPRGGLMSGARRVRLTPKALALLSFMAGRPGATAHGRAPPAAGNDRG